MELNIISLSEGWVKFRRYKCKQGYIDKWVGDCINNPNSETESKMQLNSFAEYYRFNNTEWYSKHSFKNNFFKSMIEEREFFSSEEIFKNYFIK